MELPVPSDDIANGRACVDLSCMEGKLTTSTQGWTLDALQKLYLCSAPGLV